MNRPHGCAKTFFHHIYTLWDLIMCFAKKMCVCVCVFIHRSTQARGQCHCLLGTTCFLEGFQGRGNACFSTRAHPKQVPFFRSMLWCFAWSVPFHRRCAVKSVPQTLPFSDIHVLKYLIWRGLLMSVQVPLAPLWNLVGTPSVSCSSPCSCFSVPSFHSSFLRKLSGAPQCHIHHLGVSGHHNYNIALQLLHQKQIPCSQQ